MAEREPELTEERRIRFRIGINLGDVIAEGEDIFGDGVNIAAGGPGRAWQGLHQPRGARSGAGPARLLVVLDLLLAQGLVRPVRVYRVRESDGGPADGPDRPRASPQPL